MCEQVSSNSLHFPSITAILIDFIMYFTIVVLINYFIESV